MSNGSNLYHTIRHSDDTWQDFFGLIETQGTGGPPEFVEVRCVGIGTDMHAVCVGTDAQLYHTIRHGDGTWQNFFGVVANNVSDGPGAFYHVACGGVNANLHVVAIGSDGKLYHTIHNGVGTWQKFFGAVADHVSGGPAVFFDAGCAGVGLDLEVVGVGNDGQLYHTIRYSDDTWQNFFGSVKGQVSGGPGSFTRVSCAGIGDTLEVVGVGYDGQLYYTTRSTDGTWRTPYVAVREEVVSGGPGSFIRVGCAPVGGGLAAVGLGNDGQLYYTIHNADDTWQTSFGAVKDKVVSGGPAAFTEVTSGGPGSDIYVIGGIATSGWL